MAPKLCCNCIFPLFGAEGAADLRRRKSKPGLREKARLGALFTTLLSSLDTLGAPCPLTSGQLQRVMVCCRECVFMELFFSITIGVQCLCCMLSFVTFAKHDSLSINTQSILWFFLYYFTWIYTSRGQHITMINPMFDFQMGTLVLLKTNIFFL